MAETSNNIVDALIGLVRSQLLDVNTAIPGIIVSYADGKAKVKPIGKKHYADGESLDFPVIPSARVCWPSFAQGQAGVKGPVRPGDKCLLVFSQQAIDGSDDRRMFDLQDVYAVMCDLGNTTPPSDDNTSMMMFFGAAFMRLDGNGALTINAPGGVTVTTPSTVNTGTLTTQGLLTYQSGMAGTGSGGAAATITGDIIHTSGTITSLGKKIDGTHTHSGITPGGGDTGAPNV
jgi:hypothetical protein